MPELTIMKNSRVLSEWTLDDREVTIGRGPDCHISLEDSLVSWHHAKIVKAYGGYMIEDLGSTNGMSINGRSISRQMLKYGDTIKIGIHDLCFKMAAGESRSVPSEKTVGVSSLGMGRSSAGTRSGGAKLRLLTGPSAGISKTIENSPHNIGRMGGDLASITRIGDTYILRRLSGSSTSVNDNNVRDDSVHLKNNDKIQVGIEEFRFLLD